MYAFNPNLVLSAFFQYDSVLQTVGMNARFRWTITPGSDLFVVWNKGWKQSVLEPSPDLVVPEADQIIVKLRWTFTR